MATIRFLGNAAAVAQVDRFTPANVEVDDIFTLTGTGLDGTTAAVSFTATAANVANVTAGLTAAWNASVNSLHTPITAADNTTDLTLTADTAGVAFSVAATTTEGGGNDTQTLTRVSVTKNEGPSDWSSTGNWSGGALPGGAANEDVYIEDSSVDILYGLDQSGIANTLDSLNIGQSFTGKIGSNGATGLAADYLQIKATALNIGQHYGPGSPAGSGRLKIDLGATASTVTIYNAGTPADDNKPAVRLKCNSASTTIEVRKGKVGIAYEAGETSTVGTITVSYVGQIGSDADVFISSGVTLTTLSQTGGDVTLQCAATTVTSEAGTLITDGTGAITTLNVEGGTATLNSTGAIATINIESGTAKFNSTGAITTLNIKSGTATFTSLSTIGTVNIESGMVTFSSTGAITTLNIDGGTIILGSTGAITTLNVNGGAVTLSSTGAITTLNIDGGTLESNTSGTITTCNITSGTVDFTQSATARTVTTLKIDPPGVLKYDPSVVTLTNKIQPYSSSGQITLTAA